MKVQGMWLVAFILSMVQAYSAYLLHNDLIKISIFQWVVSVIYIPLYIVLALIGGLLDAFFGLHVLKGGTVFPYLNDVLWIVGSVILFPLNLWFLKCFMRFKQ